MSPDRTTAIARVRAYIADAYEWERNVMPPHDPSFEIIMRDKLQRRDPSVTPEFAEKMRGRARAVLDSNKEHLEQLKRIAEIHCVGDEWVHEADAFSYPPKHDPNEEIVTDAQSRPDGSVDVSTVVSEGSPKEETRIYHVERQGDDWHIRSYRIKQ